MQNINRITVEFKFISIFAIVIPEVILIESQWNLNAHRMLSDFHPTPDINRITVEFKFM